MLLTAVALSTFLIRSIPQIGQVPGLSLMISGCMEQVHNSLFSASATVAVCLFLQAMKAIEMLIKITRTIKIFLFLCFMIILSPGFFLVQPASAMFAEAGLEIAIPPSLLFPSLLPIQIILHI